MAIYFPVLFFDPFCYWRYHSWGLPTLHHVWGISASRRHIQRTLYLRKPRLKKWDPRFENSWFLEATSMQYPSFKKNETLGAPVCPLANFFFRLKSFSVLSQDFRHKLSRLPLRQGSLPKSKPTSGNNFLRRICQWRSKVSGSSKSPVSWKNKFRVSKFFVKNSSKLFFRCRKMKRWESSETRFPKVWGRTEPSSGGKRPFKVLQNFNFVRCFRRRKMHIQLKVL